MTSLGDFVRKIFGIEPRVWTEVRSSEIVRTRDNAVVGWIIVSKDQNGNLRQTKVRL